MEASQEAARFQAALQRCPFCHEQVQLEQDRWVACGQCLARHHTTCWQEAPVCGACSHGVALSTDETRPAAAPAALGPVPLDVADPARDRRETAALFERDEARERWWHDGVLGPLTLGVLPMIRAERALQAHHQNDLHDLPEQPPEGLSAPMAERWLEARRSTAVSAPRRMVPLLLIMLSLLAFVVAVVTMIATPSVPYSGDWGSYAYHAYENHRTFMRGCLAVAVASLYGVLLAIHGYLHALRESVRTHERRQLYLRLLSDAVPKAVSEPLLAETTKAWSQRRLTDSLVTFLGLIPGYGLLCLPIALIRYAGTLALHHRHEERLREVTRKAGPRTDAKA